MAKHSEKGLPQELKSMVKWSVGILGKVIEERLGKKAFGRVEHVRQKMAALRNVDVHTVEESIEETARILGAFTKAEKRDFAKAYTLMLELMNVCENAYRTHRLKQNHQKRKRQGAEAIYFVLTAHPTEARAPENIAVFHEIQKILVETYSDGFENQDEKLKSLLEIAWVTEVVRMRKPRVQDEADHIYSILLRDSNLDVLLDYGRSLTPVYIRSWVGGDKDGHPGVDEKVMAKSLQMSRTLLHRYMVRMFDDYQKLISPVKNKKISENIRLALKVFSSIKKLATGDAVKVSLFFKLFNQLIQTHQNEIGKNLPDPLAKLQQMMKIFPGVVVPLELREDSSVIMSDPSGDSLAIGRMLKRIGQYAKNEDPCLYARGMIISMAQSLDHIQATGKMVKRQVGNSKIPVVPLFEQKEALDSGAKIIEGLLKDRKIRQIVKKDWNGVVEVMVGYSDSAKESGVLASRLAILDSILSIDRV